MTSWLQVEAQATQTRMALVAAWALDTNKATQFAAPTLGFCVTFGGNTDPSCAETWQQPGLDVTIALGGSVGLLNQHGHSGSMALDTNMAPDLRHPHGLQQ